MRTKLNEITIKSSSGYFSHVKYEDELKITDHSVYYTKHLYKAPDPNRCADKPVDVNWSYITNSSRFEGLFLSLFNECFFYEERYSGMTLDAGEFVIIAKNEDDSTKVIHFSDPEFDPEDESLQHIIYLIEKIIPKSEKLPDYIFHQTLDDISMDMEKLDAIITELEKKPQLNYHQGYPRWVWTMLTSLLERDFEYNPQILFALSSLDKRLNNLSFEEIKTAMTAIAREEHFDLGSVIKYIENGSLLIILKRLKELAEISDSDEED